MFMFDLSLNDFISAETLITWLYLAVINNKYYTLMLHEKGCKKWLKCCKLYSPIYDSVEKYGFSGSPIGCAQQKCLN